MYQLAEDLSELLEGANKAYVTFAPEPLDFTKLGRGGVVSVYVTGKKLDILLTDENVMEITAIFQASIFSEGFLLFAWDIKSFFSYARYFLQKEIIPQGTLVDIKVIERFLGIEKKAPASLGEALNRAKVMSKNSDWKLLYNQVLLPLIIKVVPGMETTPLLHMDYRTTVHAHYEIEGQTGGRLAGNRAFDRGFNPHSMGDDLKRKLKPVGYDKVFLYLDYKQMEVWMLSHLSDDPQLKELLDSGKDFYKVVYGLITGKEEASESARKHCKLIFIQTIYGMRPASLAKQFQISYELAQSIHDNIKNSFPVAFDWLDQREQQIKDNIGKDYFGRTRDFGDKPYRIRNFSVQAPSAMFCLERLVALYNVLEGVANVCFSVHDGYGITCSKDKLKKTYELATETLQSESLLLPGLKVPVECQAGLRLDRMKTMRL